MTRHLASLLVALASLASHPALGQRWEAGAGYSTVFLTSGDGVAREPHLYLGYRGSSRLWFQLKAAALTAREEGRTAMIVDRRWYDRSWVSLEPSVSFAFIATASQTLGIKVGASMAHRDEARLTDTYFPLFFLEHPDAEPLLMAACEQRPSCISRRTDVLLSDGIGQEGLMLAFARRKQGFSAGPTAELEYGVQFSPVKVRLFAGSRYYLLGERHLMWQAGAGVGYVF